MEVGIERKESSSLSSFLVVTSQPALVRQCTQERGRVLAPFFRAKKKANQEEREVFRRWWRGWGGVRGVTCLSLSPKSKTSSIKVSLGWVLFSSSICKSLGSDATLLSVLRLPPAESGAGEEFVEPMPPSSVAAPPAPRRLESPPVEAMWCERWVEWKWTGRMESKRRNYALLTR